MIKRYSQDEWNQKKLSQKNLQGLNFQGKNLEDFNFEKSDIRGADFTDANLKGASFKGAVAGLKPDWAIALLGILFFLATLFTIGLVIVGELAGNRMVPKHNPGIYPDVYWEELLVSGIILFLFVIFIVYVIKNQLETAFQKTFILGIIIIAFRLAIALVQFLLEVPFRHITVSLTSSVLATVVGFGIGFIAVAIAIAMLTSEIIGGKPAYIIVLLGTFLTTLSITVFLLKSGAYIISSIIGGALAFFGIILGNYIAICAFSKEKKYSLVLDIAIFVAATGGTNFSGANLTNANFAEAILKNTNFQGAILTRTLWRNAKQLDLIRSRATYLQNGQVRQLVVTGEGKNKNFDRLDLRGINLQEANLENASFIDTDFYQANLEKANLSKAILVRTQFERADLRGACLTGSCIQDWLISKETKLDGIVCEYIYLKWINGDKRDQMPPRDNFKKGDFVLFAKYILDTIDLYHNKDINPRLALTVLKKMSRDYDEPLDIVAVGKRGDRVFIKVKISEAVEAEQFKEDYLSRYDDGLKLVSSSPESLPSVDALVENRLVEIASERTDENSNINITYIEYLITPKDAVIQGEVTVETIEAGGDSIHQNGSFGIGVNKRDVYTEKLVGTITENNTMSNNYDLKHAKFGGGFAGTGGTQTGGTFYDYSSNPNLAEAATEIQQLLQQLEATNPTTTNADKRAVVNKAIDEIENNPGLKAKVVAALTSSNTEALKTAINHPLAKNMMPFIDELVEPN